MSWTDRIVNKPAQGPDELRHPAAPPAPLKLAGPDRDQKAVALQYAVDRGALTPNEARQAWNGG